MNKQKTHKDNAKTYFDLFQQGYSFIQIGEMFHCSQTSISKSIKAAGLTVTKRHEGNKDKVRAAYDSGLHSTAEIVAVTGFKDDTVRKYLHGYATHLTRAPKEKIVEIVVKPAIIISSKPKKHIPCDRAYAAMYELNSRGCEATAHPDIPLFFVNGKSYDVLKLIDLAFPNKPQKKQAVILSHQEFKNHVPKKVKWDV